MARRPTPEDPAPGAAARGGAGRRSAPALLFLSLRPGQWTKNLVVFAGLIFGRELFRPVSVWRAVAAFAVFCALSGAVYLINDVMDREADRRHPLKARRPIASGALAPGLAAAAAAALAAFALAAAFALGAPFGSIALGYVLLQLAYSGPLKHIVIVDVLAIAIGFVLRAVAGVVVVGVPISHWLLVVTILLALFLSLSKRRHELVLLAGGATEHRPILGEYSPYLLDQMISVVTASTLVAYIFYCISPETVQKFGTGLLGLTIPFPLYGIFRYLYLVHRREGGGNPSQMLLTDRPLLACVALWAAAVVVIVYLRPFGA
ncbi:MAG TPA: decaprenyl-phosphate phosphoribosyltransferase [Vicinamibacterales bacterium]|nr:decaprenyl-phosphate phosphoribosyltransferase [Vicinamibacterales bacterium]HPK71780.1 decaprenyl-phosphate phosphoribosyltransferase [Vicinamibacterales bacterium]